jgi:hypothetical protein
VLYVLLVLLLICLPHRKVSSVRSEVSAGFIQYFVPIPGTVLSSWSKFRAVALCGLLVVHSSEREMLVPVAGCPSQTWYLSPFLPLSQPLLGHLSPPSFRWDVPLVLCSSIVSLWCWRLASLWHSPFPAFYLVGWLRLPSVPPHTWRAYRCALQHLVLSLLGKLL